MNKPTKHQLAFLRRHESGVMNPKSTEPATWPLVAKCHDAGWIVINHPERGNMFPHWWNGTTLTEAGRIASQIGAGHE